MAKVKLKKQQVEIKKDNTSVKKVLPEVKKVEYKYMGKDKYVFSPKLEKATSKDSADYVSGFKAGDKEVSKNDKSYFGDKYKEGLTWRGLNPRYNEGFSEGKDVALKNKNKK